MKLINELSVKMNSGSWKQEGGTISCRPFYIHSSKLNESFKNTYLHTLTFAAVGHDAVPVILQPLLSQVFRSALVSLPESDLQYWHVLPDAHM
jgi:hypothetical protein